MQTATSTSTSIPLEPFYQGQNTVTQREGYRYDTSGPQTPYDSEVDPVLEASRIADSSVPDGGYAWVVIAACGVVSWWYTGCGYSWGIIQDALVNEGVGSPSTLAFVGSLSTALIAALAILNARVIRWLGPRLMGMIGVTFLGLSTITSSFAVKKVAGLFFTSGILLGIGSSLCFMTVSVIPAQYFSRKRGIANGIVYASGGLGGAAVSYGLGALIQRFGPAWTYRILGLSILVTGIPASWFIQERVPIKTTGFVEWRLFKDPGFILIFAIGAIGTFPLFVAPFFIPLYSRSMGLSSSTGAALLAGFNFASAVGRILCGYCCDRIGPLNTLFVSLVLTAVSMLALWPVSTTLAPMAAFVVLNGAANGGFFATMPTVIGNIFGSARVSVALGMVVSGWVGGYLMGAPIAGYLLEAYGGTGAGLQAYRPAMFYAGSLALGAAILVTVMRIRLSKKLMAKL